MKKTHAQSVTGGEFHILEVKRWTWTPMSADIGTFAVPLLAYVLIETRLKGVPRTISEKYVVCRLGYI